MKCSELMKTEVVVGRVDQSVKWAAQQMRSAHIGFLPVVDDEHRLIGVLTDRDIALRVVADDLDPCRTLLGEVCSRELVTCRPEEELLAAEQRMSSAHKSRIPVVDGAGRCLGVISLSDIAQQDRPAHSGAVLRQVSQREAPPRRH